MSDNGQKVKILTGFVLVTIGLAQPAFASGWDNHSGGWDNHSRHHRNNNDFRSHRFHQSHHSYHRHGYHYPFGRAVVVFPSGSIKIVIGGRPYHYSDGVYYQHVSKQYVVVAPPLGAIVETLPRGYDEVYIQGRVYYVNDGIYYRYCPKGYEVVLDPRESSVNHSKYDDADDDRAAVSGDEFTINIRNNNGGYTPVVLKKADNGYIGPQGEFYPSFPKVAQLKVIYGN